MALARGITRNSVRRKERFDIIKMPIGLARHLDEAAARARRRRLDRPEPGRVNDFDLRLVLAAADLVGGELDRREGAGRDVEAEQAGAVEAVGPQGGGNVREGAAQRAEGVLRPRRLPHPRQGRPHEPNPVAPLLARDDLREGGGVRLMLRLQPLPERRRQPLEA